MRERAFIMIKPEGIPLKEDIVGMLKKSLDAEIVVSKRYEPETEDFETYKNKIKDVYKEHEGKPFYEILIKQMTSGPSEVCILELGENKTLENLIDVIGDTNPLKAKPETIRGKYGKIIQIKEKDGSIISRKEIKDRGIDVYNIQYDENEPKIKIYYEIRNVIHRSREPEDAIREASLFFDFDKSLNPKIILNKNGLSGYLICPYLKPLYFIDECFEYALKKKGFIPNKAKLVGCVEEDIRHKGNTYFSDIFIRFEEGGETYTKTISFNLKIC